MDKTFFIESLNKLHRYCDAQNYKGYSLYDSHTSFIPFSKLGKTPSFLVNQLIKRSPINVRKLIGVRKAYNPKGVGLFLHAYSLQKSIGNPLNIDNIDDLIFNSINWLKNNSSQGYSGYCWGYNYPWPKKDGSLVPTFTPSSVVTGFNVRAIFQYYLLTRDKDCLDLIKGAERFILNDIAVTENDSGVCFSYTPLKRDLVINANLFAAEILAYSDLVFNKNDNQKTIKQILNFTMNHQNKNGSWYYSYDINSFKPKVQIDFHQGYILESIKRICDNSILNLSDYNNEITSGLSFYYKNQFSDQGKSYWRIPSKIPADIHNQSQGIITFSMFNNYSVDYMNFATKIVEWTIKNMQSSSNGRFYYQKWPFLTNKVSYMRWNQAWMTLALSTFLVNTLDE